MDWLEFRLGSLPGANAGGDGWDDDGGGILPVPVPVPVPVAAGRGPSSWSNESNS
jgi:hypothetical protein